MSLVIFGLAVGDLRVGCWWVRISGRGLGALWGCFLGGVLVGLGRLA